MASKRWMGICIRKLQRLSIYAWCKDTSLPLLIEKGFETGEIVTYVEKKI